MSHRQGLFVAYKTEYQDEIEKVEERLKVIFYHWSYYSREEKEYIIHCLRKMKEEIEVLLKSIEPARLELR